MRRARSKKNRVKVSFAATIAVLTLATIFIYYFSFGTPKYSVPSDLPPYGGVVGKYGPSTALQVTFDNFTAIRAINSSAVSNNRQLLDVLHPAIKVYVGSVSAQVLVTLLGDHPKVNNSGTAAILGQGAYASLAQAFSASGMVPVRDGQFSLYNITDDANGVMRNLWITLVQQDSAVVFAEGTSGAQTTVTRMLQVWEGQSPSILTLQNVTRMLYTVGGTNHLALSIQTFPGQVLTSNMGVVAVDAPSTGGVEVSNVVRFANATYASSQVDRVKASYRYAGDISQYEECVKAIEAYSIGSLQQAVRLAGD